MKLFNEPHDLFRATVRSFVEKEIAPHVEAWKPILPEECARSRSGSFAMAVGVHCDMASPHLYWTGGESLKAKYLPAICRAGLSDQTVLG